MEGKGGEEEEASSYPVVPLWCSIPSGNVAGRSELYVDSSFMPLLLLLLAAAGEPFSSGAVFVSPSIVRGESFCYFFFCEGLLRQAGGVGQDGRVHHVSSTAGGAGRDSGHRLLVAPGPPCITIFTVVVYDSVYLATDITHAATSFTYCTSRTAAPSRYPATWGRWSPLHS